MVILDLGEMVQEADWKRHSCRGLFHCFCSVWLPWWVWCNLPASAITANPEGGSQDAFPSNLALVGITFNL